MSGVSQSKAVPAAIAEVVSVPAPSGWPWRTNTMLSVPMLYCMIAAQNPY